VGRKPEGQKRRGSALEEEGKGKGPQIERSGKKEDVDLDGWKIKQKRHRGITKKKSDRPKRGTFFSGG